MKTACMCMCICTRMCLCMCVYIYIYIYVLDKTSPSSRSARSRCPSQASGARRAPEQCLGRKTHCVESPEPNTLTLPESYNHGAIPPINNIQGNSMSEAVASNWRTTQRQGGPTWEKGFGVYALKLVNQEPEYLGLLLIQKTLRQIVEAESVHQVPCAQSKIDPNFNSGRCVFFQGPGCNSQHNCGVHSGMPWCLCRFFFGLLRILGCLSLRTSKSLLEMQAEHCLIARHLQTPKSSPTVCTNPKLFPSKP